MVEIISPENIAEHIKNGSTVAVSGFVGCGCPEELLCALENAYIKKGLPRDLDNRICSRPGGWQRQGDKSPCARRACKKGYRRPLGACSKDGKTCSGGSPRPPWRWLRPSLQSTRALCRAGRTVPARSDCRIGRRWPQSRRAMRRRPRRSRSPERCPRCGRRAPGPAGTQVGRRSR